MSNDYVDGFHISAIEASTLESNGILSGTPEGDAPFGFPAETVRLFALIANAGEDGLHRSKVPKDLEQDFTKHLLPLEFQGLVNWERDNHGNLVFIVLTWKGQEALDIARPKAPQKLAWGAKRRASIRNT